MNTNNTPNTEQEGNESTRLGQDYYWQCYNVCKLGQEMPTELVQIMTDSAFKAFSDWLRSINPPEAVIELFDNFVMLSNYNERLEAGLPLTSFEGANLLDTIVEVGKNMRAVGADYYPDVRPNAVPGTLPKYILQAVETEAIPG